MMVEGKCIPIHISGHVLQRLPPAIVIYGRPRDPRPSIIKLPIERTHAFGVLRSPLCSDGYLYSISLDQPTLVNLELKT